MISLNKEDISNIADILKKAHADEYAYTLRQMSNNMCHDDEIQIDEYSVHYAHG
jgi:hypothetical protein